MAVNSDFCLEPDGDTPTRSHFYVALQAGCIHVIFDYQGDGNYSSTIKTDWPFRHCGAVPTGLHEVRGGGRRQGGAARAG